MEKKAGCQSFSFPGRLFSVFHLGFHWGILFLNMVFKFQSWGVFLDGLRLFCIYVILFFIIRALLRSKGM